MLQIIKQATKNFFNPFGKLEGWNNNEEDFTMVNGKVEEGAFLTAAELQYLKQILKDRINEDEFTRKSVLETAKVYKRIGDPFSKQCFKMHRKVKSDLKKLVKIQQKIKHSLITMG